MGKEAADGLTRAVFVTIVDAEWPDNVAVAFPDNPGPALLAQDLAMHVAAVRGGTEALGHVEAVAGPLGPDGFTCVTEALVSAESQAVEVRARFPHADVRVDPDFCVVRASIDVVIEFAAMTRAEFRARFAR